jgi:hypothetical protein
MQHDLGLLLGQVLSLERAEGHDAVQKIHRAHGRNHATISDVVPDVDCFGGFGGIDQTRVVPRPP